MDSGTRDLIEEAISRSDSSTSGWRRVNCPVCPIRMGVIDSKKSLGFHAESGYFSCFRCNVKGRLYGNYFFDSPTKKEEKVKTNIELPRGFIPLKETDSSMVTKKARKYLIGRNVPPELWETIGIGVVLNGYYGGRVIVPIYRDRKLEGWVGRLYIKNKKLKPYEYPVGMKRGDLLWNSEALQIETERPAILVEGIFDALPHYPHAVVCLGKPSLKGDQFQMLLDTKRPIAIALDGDSWKEGKALSMLLQLEGIKSDYIKLQPATDPGNLQPGTLIKKAKNILENYSKVY